jgi:hypothetical protein
MKSSLCVPRPFICFDLVRFTHNSKSRQAVGFGSFTAAGRGINESRISVNDVYKAKVPKRWSYIHLPDTPWLDAMRVDPL